MATGVISYAKGLLLILLVTAAALLGDGLASSRPILGRDKRINCPLNPTQPYCCGRGTGRPGPYTPYCALNHTKPYCRGRGTGRPGLPYRRPVIPYTPYKPNNTYGEGGNPNNTYVGGGKPGCNGRCRCKDDCP